MVLMVRHETLSPATTVVMSEVHIVFVEIRLIGRVNGIKSGVMARLAPAGVAHVFLLLAEAIRSRRGQSAWAPCHTLMAIIGPAPAAVKRQ
jgi:hypothetical protein